MYHRLRVNWDVFSLSLSLSLSLSISMNYAISLRTIARPLNLFSRNRRFLPFFIYNIN
jgi:hypothetical protein